METAPHWKPGILRRGTNLKIESRGLWGSDLGQTLRYLVGILMPGVLLYQKILTEFVLRAKLRLRSWRCDDDMDSDFIISRQKNGQIIV